MEYLPEDNFKKYIGERSLRFEINNVITNPTHIPHLLFSSDNHFDKITIYAGNITAKGSIIPPNKWINREEPAT